MSHDGLVYTIYYRISCRVKPAWAKAFLKGESKLFFGNVLLGFLWSKYPCYLITKAGGGGGFTFSIKFIMETKDLLLVRRNFAHYNTLL